MIGRSNFIESLKQPLLLCYEALYSGLGAQKMTDCVMHLQCAAIQVKTEQQRHAGGQNEIRERIKVSKRKPIYFGAPAVSIAVEEMTWRYRSDPVVWKMAIGEDFCRGERSRYSGDGSIWWCFQHQRPKLHPSR